LFTKRHYAKVAEVIENAGRRQSERYGESAGIHLVKELSYQFAIMFEDDNPNFNRKKFYDATGY